MKLYCVIFFIFFYQIAIGSDSVSISALRINNFVWYEHSSKIVVVNGKPFKKEKLEEDMESECLWKYSYLPDLYYFNKNQELCGFVLRTKRSFTIVSGRRVQIGTTLEKLKQWFPSSYQEYLQHKVFRIKLSNTDSYLVFNLNNKKVITIESWEDS